MLALAASGDASLTLLLYVAVPAFAAGLLAGVRATLWTTGATATALAVGFRPWTPVLLEQAFTWLLVSLGVGLFASWVHLLRSRAEIAEQHSYEEASKLLDDLRRVIRPLSGGLDPRPLAEQMIDEVTDQSSCRGAAVYLGLESSRELVASRGETPERGWQNGLDHGDLCVQKAIARGDRQVGLLLLNGPSGGLSPDEDRRIDAVIRAWSPRLEAAALYYEVRELATRAERARLAREMHDGLAQDIASLGYLVDDLSHGLPPETQNQLDALRTRLSEVVAELRLSIHDLRDEGLQATGLVASIAELARRDARAGDMRLHLRVQEGANALPAGVEHDLYRIAQESLANARRHSQADNLWVTCISGPGGTVIRIEDDGVGGTDDQTPGLGLQTITERALRIGAHLTIEPRQPRGTMLRVDYTAPASEDLPG